MVDSVLDIFSRPNVCLDAKLTSHLSFAKLNSKSEHWPAFLAPDTTFCNTVQLNLVKVLQQTPAYVLVDLEL
jgi:hypothetical protein